MKKIFVVALLVSAALQFVFTRYRAGQATEEGAAEAMWLRYPLVVLANALLWMVISASLARGIGAIRRMI